MSAIPPRPARLRKPPTKKELILALFAVDSAYTVLRTVVETRGELKIQQVEEFFGDLVDLRHEIAADTQNSECFHDRALELHQDETYADELPDGEIA